MTKNYLNQLLIETFVTEFKKMKIAIIGFGWLGFPLGKSLLEKGHQIVGTTTTLSKIKSLEENGFSVVELDFSQDLPQNLNSFFEKTDICILNFPPRRNNSNSDFRFYGEQLLKAIQPFPVETKFIFVSSTGIYPDSISVAKEDVFNRLELVNENHLAFAEETLHQKLKERLTIIRMAGLIGEDRQIAKYFAGKENLPNGKTPVNLIHQKDCIGIIEMIIEKQIWGEIFNACASEHPTKEKYYTYCCEKLNLALPSYAKEESTSICKIVDNQKSKSLLGYQYLLDNPFDFFHK
jgi:nucleoside-diphosphate-sugar epimerase